MNRHASSFALDGVWSRVGGTVRRGLRANLLVTPSPPDVDYKDIGPPHGPDEGTFGAQGRAIGRAAEKAGEVMGLVQWRAFPGWWVLLFFLAAAVAIVVTALLFPRPMGR